MDIDVQPIMSELQELNGQETVKVKLNRKLEVASSIRITDNGYQIQLNPRKIRSEATLEKHLNICRKAIGEV